MLTQQQRTVRTTNSGIYRQLHIHIWNIQEQPQADLGLDMWTA